MRELRFHRELYRGECVDEAIKVYASYATITALEEATHWVVQIESSSDSREKKIGDEMANYALGLTIRNRGV